MISVVTVSSLISVILMISVIVILLLMSRHFTFQPDRPKSLVFLVGSLYKIKKSGSPCSPNYCHLTAPDLSSLCPAPAWWAPVCVGVPGMNMITWHWPWWQSCVSWVGGVELSWSGATGGGLGGTWTNIHRDMTSPANNLNYSSRVYRVSQKICPDSVGKV